jgi:hypothetical protein
VELYLVTSYPCYFSRRSHQLLRRLAGSHHSLSALRRFRVCKNYTLVVRTEVEELKVVLAEAWTTLTANLPLGFGIVSTSSNAPEVNVPLIGTLAQRII